MLSQSEISQPMPLWVDIIVKLTPTIIALMVGGIGVWISYNLTSSISTLMVGGIGVWIAYNQYRTAKDKLRLDLFEKRLAAYEKLQEYFMFVFQLGRVDGQAIQILGEARYKSRFLFGDDITKNIDEVWDKALTIQDLDFKLKDSLSLPIGEERKRVSEELRKALIWNDDQQKSSPERYDK
ncbi:MAG: hypothetical protein ACK491_16810, partial [Pseudanabaena sp.]